MTRRKHHIWASLFLAIPVTLSAQTPADWPAIEELVAQHAENHQAALICYRRGTAEYTKTLNDWELRISATIRLMVENGYPQNDAYDLRGTYGPAAIFPSNLYSDAELEQFCAKLQPAFDQFQSPQTVPLHSAVRRILRGLQDDS